MARTAAGRLRTRVACCKAIARKRTVAASRSTPASVRGSQMVAARGVELFAASSAAAWPELHGTASVGQGRCRRANTRLSTVTGGGGCATRNVQFPPNWALSKSPRRGANSVSSSGAAVCAARRRRQAS
ncbi:MAG: hypothetical protein ABI478_06740 [Propionivibrio sp.]